MSRCPSSPTGNGSSSRSPPTSSTRSRERPGCSSHPHPPRPRRLRRTSLPCAPICKWPAWSHSPTWQTPRDPALLRRLERIKKQATADWSERPALSLMLMLWCFLQDLVEREVLILWEGSAMDGRCRSSCRCVIMVSDHRTSKMRLGSEAVSCSGGSRGTDSTAETLKSGQRTSTKAFRLLVST